MTWVETLVTVMGFLADTVIVTAAAWHFFLREARIEDLARSASRG